MAKQKWILILTILMAVAQQIHTACVCDEKGTDACAKCSGITIPKPKHTVRPDFELPPIGDNCGCSKTMIEPAALPKPSPKLNKPPPSCRCPTQSYVMPEVNYNHAPVKDDSPSADPISIGLSIQAGKAVEVPEAKLAYGFVRKPINSLPKVFISAIKEENLYALANDVITLKKSFGPKIKIPEEDYPEPEEEEPASEYYEPPSLTYKQLGYETENFHNPEFVPIPPALAETVGLVRHKIDLDCGFKPGRIANLGHVTKFEPTNCSEKE